MNVPKEILSTSKEKKQNKMLLVYPGFGQRKTEMCFKPSFLKVCYCLCLSSQFTLPSALGHYKVSL